MNTQGPTSWTGALTKAAWTLLLTAVAVFIAWQLLKALLVPLIVVLALVGVMKLAVGVRNRDGW